MKNKIVILLFLVTGIIYSQQPQIRAVDTLFISFKSNKSQTKSIYKGSSKSDYLFRQYNFLFKYNDETNFSFYHNEYSKINIENVLVKSTIKVVDKKYIKKHKRAIIGIQYFKKFGVCDSIYLRSTKPKIIYIIDCDETKKNKITLYEVSGSTTSCSKEDFL